MKATQFKDKKNRIWEIKFSYSTIKAVRAADTGVDLATLLANQHEGLQDLQKDIIRWIDTIYVMVSDQHPDVSSEEFGEALGGRTLQDMIDAFMQSLVDFCPSQQGEMLGTMLTKGKSLQKAVQETVSTASLSEITSGELDSKLEQLLGGRIGLSTPSGNSSGH